MSSHNFPNLHILDHPLIQHKLTMMRMKDTTTGKFRRLLKETAMLMGYEVTRNFPTRLESIETPEAGTQSPVFAGKDVAIVPILRAGLGMAEGLLELMPTAREGHIGLYRDPKTYKPVEYFVKLPEVENRIFILVDPMLATGNSAAYAMDVLNKNGVPDDHIKFLALVAVPEGVTQFNKTHGDVPIYVASLDEGLNEKVHIVPGLGDAGDRLFGTK